MATRSLLREALANGHAGADFSRRSPRICSGKDGMHLCGAALPIAAEIQAILKGSGHLAPDPDSKSCIFGCSPPPRDCTNALVRDSSFSSMRLARPAGGASAAGSCSTSYFQSCERVNGFALLSCMSPQASALSTA